MPWPVTASISGVRPVGPQALVDVPVAEARVVVAAAAEPAVVEDEAFHAELGGRIGEFEQGLGRRWSKYTASQVLSTTGRTSSGRSVRRAAAGRGTSRRRPR